MSDWVTAKLKEVAKVVTGKTPQTSNSEYYGGDIPFVSPADLNESILIETKTYLTSSGADQVYRVPKNTVLVSCIGNLGKLAITSKEVCFNQQINGLIFDEQKIFPKYGFYFAQTLKPQLEKASSSTTLPIVNKSRFSDLEIKYPPLTEQRRIASILDQADELRQKRQQAIEKLDQLLQAMFIDMFGDPIENTKGLEVVPLLDLCKKITDGTHQSPKWATEGIPFLFISNIVDGEIDYSSQKFIDKTTYDLLTKSTKIELNDILYTTVGSYGNVARVKSDQLFCFQRHIAHIKPNFDKVNPEFLERMLATCGIKKQADRLVRGVAQKTLNLKDLKEIIVFNIPLSEQHNFVQKCVVIEALKIKFKEALIQSENLFNSLQNQAFSGNL
ncbi:TPA: restriction endonuclease subunit S [Acinetobacter baumannii]|nr:restriction endonuclease subunit S [Acinetobacter baumannii]